MVTFCRFLFCNRLYLTTFVDINQYNIFMIALRIKEICKSKKMTLNELAEKIGVSQPSISGLATGKIKPSFDTLERLADALEVAPSELFAPASSDSFLCPHCGKPIEVRKPE